MTLWLRMGTGVKVHAIVHFLGVVFQPLFDLFGSLLAFCYTVVPNYPIDVALLTTVIMLVATPLTVKSMRSMQAMQALAPEMRKLQAKYKGIANQMELQEELSKLYKEAGVHPASGCVPVLIQLPFFFILYKVIFGITNTVSSTVHRGGRSVVIVKAMPRYIPTGSRMYAAITGAKPPGSLNAFGVNFALKLFSHHGDFWDALPFLLLVALAVGLQYLQMARLNARNSNSAAMVGQAAAVQKIMPFIFTVVYISVPAILTVYFLVSNLVRTVTQETVFMNLGRFGTHKGVPRLGMKKSGGGLVRDVERSLPGGKGSPGKSNAVSKGDVVEAKVISPKPKPSAGGGESKKSAKSVRTGGPREGPGDKRKGGQPRAKSKRPRRY